MDSEWIEHDGKGYPDLPRDALVQVRHLDGEESGDWGQSVTFWMLNWRWDPENPCPADITHYREVGK